MLSRLMTRREQMLLLAVAVSIVIGALALWWNKSRAPAPPTPTAAQQAKTSMTLPPSPNVAPVPVKDTTAPVPQKENTSPSTSQAIAKKPARIGVGISGAVKRPGLYYFDPEARVGDLIHAAGGLTPDADTAQINQAATLIDSTTLWIPFHTLPANKTSSVHAKKTNEGHVLNPPEYLLQSAQP
ncbi:MAG TPA: SLBB domain-containing protein [Candidatus Hydrogenedentes bacterium]|nr:SLBB domain-containing protein [Candidatus Hydrogenedentota bacterium]